MGSQSIGDRLSVVLTVNHFKLLADGYLGTNQYAADVMLASLLRYAPALAKCPKCIMGLYMATYQLKTIITCLSVLRDKFTNIGRIFNENITKEDLLRFEKGVQKVI